MTKVEREDILIPLLEGYYDKEETFFEQFYELIMDEKPIYLSKPFGLSIIITNFSDKEKTKSLIAALKNQVVNKGDFLLTHESEYHYHRDDMDDNLFEEKSRFSFDRTIFKSKKLLELKLINKKNNYISFSLFISIAQFKDIDKSIVSFIFTTWNKDYAIEDTYMSLSNTELIDLIPTNLKNNRIKSNELIEKAKEMEEKISDFLNIDRNTFFGLELWRKDWNDKQDNLINVLNYIRKSPYYFYSLTNFDKNIYRRNYKNIMDSLGWCFSASRAHCGIISKNIYVSVSLKPKKERFEITGHDGTEFKAWEILGLQNFLLDQIDKEYREDYSSRHNTYNMKLEKLIDELYEVYDVNAIFGKKKKGDIWIKFNKYAQDQIGITSNYELHESRSQRLLNEARETSKSNLVSFINLIISSLVLITIFISIIAIYLNNYTVRYVGWFPNINGIDEFEIFKFLGISFLITTFLSFITIRAFYNIFRRYVKKNKYMKLF